MKKTTKISPEEYAEFQAWKSSQKEELSKEKPTRQKNKPRRKK